MSGSNEGLPLREVHENGATAPPPNINRAPASIPEGMPNSIPSIRVERIGGDINIYVYVNSNTYNEYINSLSSMTPMEAGDTHFMHHLFCRFIYPIFEFDISVENRDISLENVTILFSGYFSPPQLHFALPSPNNNNSEETHNNELPKVNPDDDKENTPLL